MVTIAVYYTLYISSSKSYILYAFALLIVTYDIFWNTSFKIKLLTRYLLCFSGDRKEGSFEAHCEVCAAQMLSVESLKWEVYTNQGYATVSVLEQTPEFTT